jgi:cystathionine beta-lyase/cystathionine gamma-synthase
MTASTYRTPVNYELDDPGHYTYGRYSNPTRDGVEEVVAALEGAKHSYIFASGNILNLEPCRIQNQ